MSRQCVLEELPVGSALLFAGSRYGPDACISLSASVVGSNPFVPELFSRVFGTGVVSAKSADLVFLMWYFITFFEEMYK